MAEGPDILSGPSFFLEDRFAIGMLALGGVSEPAGRGEGGLRARSIEARQHSMEAY